jgi:hypothetical protein
MSCFSAITIPGLEKKFNDAVKEDMTEMEVRTIGTRIALEHLKDVNKRINELRVATGLKKEKIVIDDKAKEIKEVRATSDKSSQVAKPTVDKVATVESKDTKDNNATESREAGNIKVGDVISDGKFKVSKVTKVINNTDGTIGFVGDNFFLKVKQDSNVEAYINPTDNAKFKILTPDTNPELFEPIKSPTKTKEDGKRKEEGQKVLNAQPEVKKKTWWDFISYNENSRISDSLKMKDEKELRKLLSDKIKRRDSAVTPRGDKLRLREEVWDIEKLLKAHDKANEYNAGLSQKLQTNATESKVEVADEQPATPHTPEATLTFRKGFQNDLDQLSGKIKQKDGSTLKDPGKRKKLDGMTTRLNKAKAEGVITQEEFDEKYEMISRGYTKLSDSNPKAPKASPDAKPTTQDSRAVPTTGTKVDTTDNTMSDYAKNNSWNAFKNKYPNVEKQAYYDMRDEAARAASQALADKARSLKVSNNTLNDAILGIPIAIWNGMLETVATLAEAGGTVAELVTSAVEYLKAELQGEKFTDKEIEKAVKAEFARVGLAPEAQKPGDPKQSIKENIVDSKFEKSGRITFRQLFSKINHAKRTTADAISEIQAEVTKYFKKNGIDMSKGRIVNVMKQLTELASMDDSVEALVDVIESIDNIIAEQEHANDIAEARDTIKKFKKFRKKSKMLLAPYRAILDKIELVSPTLIAMTGGDLKQFTESLNTIMKEYGGAQVVRELTKNNLEYMVNKMKVILSDVAVHLEQKSVDKYNLLASKGKVNGMAYDEWMEDKQDKLNLNKLNQKTVNSANKGKPMDKLLGLIRLQKERLQEALKELNQRFLDEPNDSDYLFQKKIAQELIDMDIDVLNEEGAMEMNNIINNIINDGNYFNSGRFLSFWKDAHQVNKENMNLPMRIRYAAAKKARSLATLFLSLTYNEKDAGKLREQLFSPVSEAATKAQRIMYGYGNNQGVIHDVHNILKKFGKDNHHIKRSKVGIFQFLNQAASTDPEVKVSTDPHALEARLNMPESEPGKSKEQDFRDRLQSIINGSVKGLYQLGMDNEDNGGATAKGLKDNALATADALVQMGLIEGYTTGSKGIEVQEIEGVSLDKLYDKLDNAEKELYEYIKDKFADDEFLKAMKRTAESVHGMLWEGKENYAPQIAKRYNNDKGSAQKTIEDIGNGDFRGSGGKKVGVRPSDRFMQRGKLANLEEFYYSMDAVSNFITSYYESQLAINGARELKALSYVLNSGDFKDFMNGVYNKSIYGKSVKFDVLNNDTGRSQYSQLLERFAEILRDTANPPFLYKDTRGFAEKALTWVMSGVTATYLQTSDQILKQLGPNIAAGMSISGAMPTGIAIRELTNGFTSKENAEALNKFLSNFEGDFRSPMGEEILDEVNKMMNNPKGLYASMLGLTAIKDNYSPVRMSRAIMRKSDRAAYNINAIAAYINAEVQAGRLKSASDFNIVEAAENPNRSSVAIALNQSEMLNNASKAAERAPYTRSKQNDPDINDRWIYNIMYLKGFSLNSFMNFSNNLGIAVNRKGRATAEEQRAATLRAVSYGVQIGVFNVIKIAILKTAYNAIGGVLSSAVFGLDAPEETDEEIAKKKRARVAELGWQSLADAAIGWAPSPVEAGAKAGVNWIFDAVTEDVKGERKKLPYYLTQGSGTGSAQTLMDIPEAFMEGFKQRGGKSSPLTAEANAALDKMDWAKVAALSFGQGDLLKVMYGMEREIREAGKKPKSTKSGPSETLKSFNKAFGNGSFKNNRFNK